MEYAAGGTLRDRLRREGHLPERECRRIGGQIAEALAHAHAHGVLHRDVKPSNVLLDAAGAAKVADFGLSKVLSDASSRMSTSNLVGTPAYLPPEVLRKQAVDARGDLYSLGCLLYEIATGKSPFRGSLAEVAASKLIPGADAPDPRSLRSDLSEGYAAIVTRLLADDPEARLPDAASCVAALRGAPLPDPAMPGARAPVPSGGAGRRKGLALAAGLLVLAAGGAALAVLGGRGPGHTPALESPAVREGRGRAPPPAKAPADPLLAASPATPGPVAAAPPAPGLRVFSEPPGASISVGGRPRGVAGEEGLVLTGLPEGIPFRVTASLDDHEPAEAKDQVWKPGSTAPLRLSLSRARGMLRFAIAPRGASVTATARGIGTRDVMLADDGTTGPTVFEVGEYGIHVSRKGCRSREVVVRVRPGETGEVAVTLEEMDGLLTLESHPSNAEAWEGMELLGRTPLRDLRLRPGRHEIRLVRADCDDTPVVAEIRGEERTVLRPTLLPLAVLDLTELDDGVTASLDGSPLAHEKVLRKPGPVTLVLAKENCRPQEAPLVLRGGETTVPPAKPWRPLPGALDTTNLPPEIGVLVDGVPQSRASPLLEVEAGPHQIDLVRTGFLNFTSKEDVPPGETVVLENPRWSPTYAKKAMKTLAAPPQSVTPEIPLPPGFMRESRRIYCERDGAEMVVIPAGEFAMGSDQGPVRERPVHRVRLSAFLLDRHEVTSEQFSRFVKETRHQTEAERDGVGYGWKNGKWTQPLPGASWKVPLGSGSSWEAMSNHPVIFVSWNDAMAYCRWAGKRLPTEAEWERAARGGLERERYPWGSAEEPLPPQAGNLADETAIREVFKESGGIPGYRDSHARTSPVGSFPASSFGLFDISGNVDEWCSDWFSETFYATSEAVLENPGGPSAGTIRSYRGSNWGTGRLGIYVALRNAWVPEGRFDTIGFRTARSLP